MLEFSASKEQKIILLLCGLAALHIFIFSAAFPFFNNVDEHPQFDLVLKYSHGHLPHGIEPVNEESSEYILTYGSPEFISSSMSYPNNQYPQPLWVRFKNFEADGQTNAFQQASAEWQKVKAIANWQNYESSQQPVYYLLAGQWWRLGQWCGLRGLHLIYWLRFLDIFFVIALAFVAHIAARLIFPAQIFPRIGVPSVIAFAPIQAFYSIDNDALTSLAFGIAFIFLIRFWFAEIPGIRLGIATGLALAGTFLVKLSNAPLLATSGIFIAVKMFQLMRNKKLRASLPSLAVFFLCAALPSIPWLLWTRHEFGDFGGTAAKLHFLTWTHKPFTEWFHHPMFTPHGFWTFWSALLIAFWQGEFWWHGIPLHQPVVDALFVIPSIALILFGLAGLVPKFGVTTPAQRPVLAFSLALWISGALFLGWLSISYDFGTCINPSKEYPFFAAGRLMLGALVPFLIFCFSGLNFILRDVKNKWARPVILVSIILFMLVSEIITDWNVFQSQYNWYHL